MPTSSRRPLSSIGVTTMLNMVGVSGWMNSFMSNPRQDTRASWRRELCCGEAALGRVSAVILLAFGRHRDIAVQARCAFDVVLVQHGHDVAVFGLVQLRGRDQRAVVREAIL